MRIRVSRLALVGLVATLVASACGGGAAPVTSATPSVAGTAAATELPGVKTFSQSGGDRQLSYVPTLMAAEALKSKGYTISQPVVKDVSLGIDGLTRGEFQFGYGAVNAYMLAIQKGAPIKIIAEAVKNEWQFFATSSITSCSQLSGKKMGISSAGGVSTALVKAWIQKECPGTTPQYLVISNSADRLAALLNGQLDASPIQIQDGIVLQSQGGTRFKKLVDFADSLPDIMTTALVVNADWAAKNPGSVQADLRAILEAHRAIAGDPNLLKQQVDHFVSTKDMAAGFEPAVIDAYRLKWNQNGGITEQSFQGTIDFFTSTGAIEKGLTTSQALDLSYLNAVLKQIGTK